VSVQDRCTVCAKCTIGLKSFWMHLIVLLVDEAQVDAHFSPFGDRIILTQDRCMVCVERTIGSEIILDQHPMEHLGDVGHVEFRIGLFVDGFRVGVRLVHGLRQMYTRLSNPFG
jgi:hypothetical protein